VRQDVRRLAPMLIKLGYDPDGYPPKYGEADSVVANNTMHIKHNEQFWQQQALAVQQQTKAQASVVVDHSLNADMKNAKDQGATTSKVDGAPHAR